MSKTLLVSTSLGLTSSTSMYTTDDEKIVLEKTNHVVATTLTTTTSSAISNTISETNKRRVYEKYASAYVESMSDEELTDALEKMNLLLSEDDQIKNSKMI